MKYRLKVDVLFKSGVEKTYYGNIIEEKIDYTDIFKLLKKSIGTSDEGNLYLADKTVIRKSSIDSITLQNEVVEND